MEIIAGSVCNSISRGVEHPVNQFRCRTEGRVGDGNVVSLGHFSRILVVSSPIRGEIVFLKASGYIVPFAFAILTEQVPSRWLELVYNIGYLVINYTFLVLFLDKDRVGLLDG